MCHGRFVPIADGFKYGLAAVDPSRKFFQSAIQNHLRRRSCRSAADDLWIATEMRDSKPPSRVRKEP